MTAPVLFLLAVLGCGLAEGRIFSTCELKEHLRKEIDKLQQNGHPALGGEILLAKLVCHADHASGFNTSAVTTQNSVTDSSANNAQPPTQSPNGSNLSKPATHPTPPTQSNPPPPQRKRGSTEDDLETFYGIFQLSNYVACSDGINPSLNICGLDCSDLTDDDIHDDIVCLLKILANILTNGFKADQEVQRMIRLILEPRCSDAPPLDCPQS